MRASRLVAATGLACVACLWPEPARVPTSFDDRDVQSAALLSVPALSSPDGVSGVFLDLTRATYLFEPVEPNVAALYTSDAEALAWDTQRLRHEPELQSRLRRPDAVFQRDQEGAWVRAPDATLDAAALKGLRFGPTDACADGRMCIDDAGYCTVDCPEPMVAPPVPPAPWPGPRCPPGVRTATQTVLGERLTVCRADGLRCEGATRPVAGGCAPLGRACSADAEGWPSAPPPAGRHVWVRSRAGAGGDGSRARPLSIDDALRVSRPGDVLILSAGEHTSSVFRLVGELTVFGVCADETALQVSMGSRIAARVTVDGLRLGDADGLIVEAAGDLELRGVHVSGGGGVLPVEGRLHAEECAIEGAPLRAGSAGPGTLALRRSDLRSPVEVKGRAELEDVWVRTQGPVGIDVADGAFARFVDAVFGIGVGAIGVRVGSGARVDAERVTASGDGKVVELNAGARLTAEELSLDVRADLAIEVITATAALRAVAVVGARLAALRVSGASRVELDRWTVSAAPRAFSLEANGSGAPTFVASDLRIVGSSQALKGEVARLELRRAHVGPVSEPGAFGPAIELRPRLVAAEFDVADLRIDDARGAGLWVVQDPDAGPEGFDGRLARVLVGSVGGIGVAVDGLRGTFSMTDVRVVRAGPEGRTAPCRTAGAQCAGTGFYFSGRDLSIALERFAVEQAGEVGLWVAPGNRLRARDGRVGPARAGLNHPADGDWRDDFRFVRFATGARP